jgi:hypothetical protein
MVIVMLPNQNPYEFITSGEAPAKQPFFGGGSTKSRILRVVVIGAVILFGAVLAFNFLSKGKTTQLDRLYLLSAQQTDLIDITKIGAEKVRDSKTNQKMTTANILITSQSVQMADIVKKSGGGKSATKKIKLLQNIDYKKTLEEAESAGKYEETFAALYSNRLGAYANQLQSANAGSTGQTKQKISTMYSQLDAISLSDTQPQTPVTK